MSQKNCGSPMHFSRRSLLQAAGAIGAASWLTPLSHLLAEEAERAPKGTPARSLIMLWLQGGPSQLETFDPHAGTAVSHTDLKAIKTRAAGVELADGFERTADVMDEISLIRSVFSKEGDHERATYNGKTGYRPDPTLVHPAIGSVLCHAEDMHEAGEEGHYLSGPPKRPLVEIPRHISIMPGQWPARGGYLGDQYDAFKINDPLAPIPDVTPSVSDERFRRRLSDLEKIVENQFARGRLEDMDKQKTLHATSIRNARRMMSSEQLAAFKIDEETQAIRDDYGDTPFGRGCLCAARLVGVGVPCVEVTLNGWDSHVNNLETQRARVDELDPALAALIRDLKRRDLLKSTVVVVAGEFGRTPNINPTGGRDHWPHGFSVALAGGGIRGGLVYGKTDAVQNDDENDRHKHLENPREIADVHATILLALGVNYKKYLDTPVNRPMQICQGKPIEELLVG